MRKKQTPVLIIDPDFKFLIQPLSDEKYAFLEETLFDNGCHEPLSVWKNIIVDGHKRYEICNQWDIPYTVRKADYRDRCDVISFICATQLERDDITVEYKKYLTGKKYLAETEIGARKLMLKNFPKSSEHTTFSNRPCNKYETARLLAAKYNMSHATVLKYGTYAKSIDSIKEKDPDIALKILLGQLKISHENIIELARLPKEDLKCLKAVLQENHIERIGYSEIRHELQWKRLPTTPPKEKPHACPQIRKMPSYDPDAGISSLALTIPSWIESIERAKSHTEFTAITTAAKHNLVMQLMKLKKTIHSIETSIEEAKTNDG